MMESIIYYYSIIMADQTPKKIKTKKILFMTAAGSHNLWDELILKWEVEYIQKHYGKNIDITVFTYDQTGTIINDSSIKYVSYFPNNFGADPLKNIGYFFKNIWIITMADVLIVGWGGILFDNEPGVDFWMLFMQWLFRVKLARITRTIIVFWWIGLEIKEVKNKMRLRKLFVPGDFIFVRDAQSKWLLDALELPSVQIQDIVFLYTPPLNPAPKWDNNMVWISVRWWFLEENESLVPLMYDKLIELWYNPIFLVFSTDGEESQNDSQFIRKVMVGKTYNVTKTIAQTLEVYPRLHSVIGMRLHSWILACVHDIPFLPISYGPKTNDLMSLLEIEHLGIQSRDFTLEAFTTNWKHLTDNYQEEKEHMQMRHLYISQTLKTDLKNI